MPQAQNYLRSLPIPALLFATACGGDGDPSEQHAAQREECTFERGALPVETLGTSVPLGDQIPNDPNGQRALGYLDGSDLPFLVTYPTYFGDSLAHISNNTDQFFADLDAGTLAPVVWIDPAFYGTVVEETDEHPPTIPQAGEAFVENIIRGVIASELWPRTAIILTYSEAGLSGEAPHRVNHRSTRRVPQRLAFYCRRATNTSVQMPSVQTTSR